MASVEPLENDVEEATAEFWRLFRKDSLHLLHWEEYAETMLRVVKLGVADGTFAERAARHALRQDFDRDTGASPTMTYMQFRRAAAELGRLWSQRDSAEQVAGALRFIAHAVAMEEVQLELELELRTELPVRSPSGTSHADIPTALLDAAFSDAVGRGTVADCGTAWCDIVTLQDSDPGCATPYEPTQRISSTATDVDVAGVTMQRVHVARTLRRFRRPHKTFAALGAEHRRDRWLQLQYDPEDGATCVGDDMLPRNHAGREWCPLPPRWNGTYRARHVRVCRSRCVLRPLGVRANDPDAFGPTWLRLPPPPRFLDDPNIINLRPLAKEAFLRLDADCSNTLENDALVKMVLWVLRSFQPTAVLAPGKPAKATPTIGLDTTARPNSSSRSERRKKGKKSKQDKAGMQDAQNEVEREEFVQLKLALAARVDADNDGMVAFNEFYDFIVVVLSAVSRVARRKELETAAAAKLGKKTKKGKKQTKKRKKKTKKGEDIELADEGKAQGESSKTATSDGTEMQTSMLLQAMALLCVEQRSSQTSGSKSTEDGSAEDGKVTHVDDSKSAPSKRKQTRIVKTATQYVREHDEEGDHPMLFYSGFEPVLRPAQCYFELRKRRWPSLHWLDGGLAGEQPHLPFDTDEIFPAFDAAQALARARLTAQANAKAAAKGEAENAENGRGEGNEDEAFVPLEEKPKSYDLALPLPPVRSMRDFDLQRNVANAQERPEIEVTNAVFCGEPPFDVPPPHPTFVTAPQYSPDVLGVGAGNAASRVRVKPSSFRQLLASCLSSEAHAEAVAEEVSAKELENKVAAAPPASQPALASGLAASGWGVMSEMVRPPPKSTLATRRRSSSASKADITPTTELSRQNASPHDAAKLDDSANKVGRAFETGASDATSSMEATLTVSAEDAAGISGAISVVQAAHQDASKPFVDLARDILREREQAVQLRMQVRAKRSKMRALAAAAVAAVCAAHAASKAVSKADVIVASAIAAEQARHADAQGKSDEHTKSVDTCAMEIDSDNDASPSADEEEHDDDVISDIRRDGIGMGINGSPMNNESDVHTSNGMDEATLAKEGAWRSTNPLATASAAEPQSCRNWPPRRRARRGTVVGGVDDDRVVVDDTLDGGGDNTLFETARTLPLAIVVIGPPLAGKTSLAARLARALGLRLISGGEEVRRALAAVSTIAHSQKKRGNSPIPELSTSIAAQKRAVDAAQSIAIPPPTQLQRLVAASVQKSREARTANALAQATEDIAPKPSSSTAPPESGSLDSGSSEHDSPSADARAMRVDGDQLHVTPQQASYEPVSSSSTFPNAGIAPDLIEKLIAAALEAVHATGQGYVLDCDGEGCAEALALGMGLSLLPPVTSDHDEGKSVDTNNVNQTSSTDCSKSEQAGIGVGVGGRIRLPPRADIIIEFCYDDVAAHATSSEGHGAFMQVAKRLHALRVAHAEIDRDDAKKARLAEHMAVQSSNIGDKDELTTDTEVADEEQSDEHKQVPVEPLALGDDKNCEVDVEQSDLSQGGDSKVASAAHMTASILERTLPEVFPVTKQRIDVQHSASISARVLIQEHERRDLAASALELMLAVLHERYAATPCSVALERLCRVAWHVSSEILVATERGDNDIKVHVDEQDILLRARPDIGSDGESGVKSGSTNACMAEASARLDGAILGTNGGVLAAEALAHTIQPRASSPTPSTEKSGQKSKSALRKSFGAALKFQGITMSQGRAPSPTGRNELSNEQSTAHGQRKDAGASLVSAPTQSVAFGGSYCSRAFTFVDGGGDGGSGDGRGSNQQRRQLCAKYVPPSGRAWIAGSLHLKISRSLLRTFREACAGPRRLLVCTSHATQDEVFASVLHRLGCGSISDLDVPAHARMRNEPLVLCRSTITMRVSPPFPLILPRVLAPSGDRLTEQSDRVAAEQGNESGLHDGTHTAAIQRAQWLWLLHGDAAESTPSSNVHAVAWPTLLYPPPTNDHLNPHDPKSAGHDELEGSGVTTDSPRGQTIDEVPSQYPSCPTAHVLPPRGARPFARRWSPWRRCCPVAFFHARQRAQALLHPDALASAWLALHGNAWAKGSNEITLPPQGDKELDAQWKQERNNNRADSVGADVDDTSTCAEGEKTQAKPLGPKAAGTALQKLVTRITNFATPPAFGLAQHCASWCGRLFSFSSASALDAFVANAGPFVASGKPRLQGPLRLTLLPSPSLLRYGRQKAHGTGAAVLRAAATNLATLYGLKLIEVSTGLTSSVRRASVIGKEPGKKASAGERVAARKRDERVVSTVVKAVNDRIQYASSRVAEAISRRLTLDDGEAELAELMTISRDALHDLFEAKCYNDAKQTHANQGPVPISAAPSASASVAVQRHAESVADSTTKATRAKVANQPNEKVRNVDVQPRLAFNDIVALLRNDCDALWTDSCAPARRGLEAKGAPTHGTMQNICSHRGYSTLRMVLVARREALRTTAAKKLKAKGKPSKSKSTKQAVPKTQVNANKVPADCDNATSLAPVASNGDLMVSWTEFVNGVKAVALMRADAQCLLRAQNRFCAQSSTQATLARAPWQIPAPALERHRIDRVIFEGRTRIAGVSHGGKRIVVEVDRSSGVIHALWPWGFGVEPSGIGGAGVSARWAAGRRHGRISFGTTDDEPLATPEDWGPARFAAAQPTYSPAQSHDVKCISVAAINRLGATAAADAAVWMPDASPPTTSPDVLDEFGRRSLPLCLRPGWSWEGEWTANDELIGLGRQIATGAVATFSFRLVKDADDSDGSNGSDLSDDDAVPAPPSKAKNENPYANASAIDINPDAADVSGAGLLVLGAPHTVAQFKSLVSQKITLGTVIVVDAPECMQEDSDSDAEDESNNTTQAAMAEAAAAEDAAFEEMVQLMQETAHKSRAKYESALQDSVFGHGASVAAQCKAVTTLIDPPIMALHRILAKPLDRDDAHQQYLLRSMRQAFDPFFQQADDEADMPPSILVDGWASAREKRWKIARAGRMKKMAAERRRNVRQLTSLRQKLQNVRPDHTALQENSPSEDESAPGFDDNELHVPSSSSQLISAGEILAHCQESAQPNSSAAVVAAAVAADELATAEARAYAHEIRKHLDAQSILDAKKRRLQQSLQKVKSADQTLTIVSELDRHNYDKSYDRADENSDIEASGSRGQADVKGIEEGESNWDSAGWTHGSIGIGCCMRAAEHQVVGGFPIRPPQQPASEQETVMICGRRYGCRNAAALRRFECDPAAHIAASSTSDVAGTECVTTGAAAVLLLAPRGSTALEIASNAAAASTSVAIPLRLATPAIVGNVENRRYSLEIASKQPFSILPRDTESCIDDVCRLFQTAVTPNELAAIPSLGCALAWEASRARRVICLARARATACDMRRKERQLASTFGIPQVPGSHGDVRGKLQSGGNVEATCPGIASWVARVDELVLTMEGGDGFHEDAAYQCYFEKIDAAIANKDARGSDVETVPSSATDHNVGVACSFELAAAAMLDEGDIDASSANQWSRPDAVVVLLPSRASALARRCEVFDSYLLRVAQTAARNAACAAANSSKAAAKNAHQIVARAVSKHAAKQAATAAIRGQYSAATAVTMAEYALAQAVADAGQKNQKKLLVTRAKAAKAIMEATKENEAEMLKRLESLQEARLQHAVHAGDELQGTEELLASKDNETTLAFRLAQLRNDALERFEAEYDRDMQGIVAALEKVSEDGVPIGRPVGADIRATLAISDVLSKSIYSGGNEHDDIDDGSVPLQLAIDAVWAVSNAELDSDACPTSAAHEASAARRLRAVVKDLRVTRHRRVFGNTLIQTDAAMPLTLAAARKALASGEATTSAWGGVCPVATRAVRRRLIFATGDHGESKQLQWVASGLGEGGLVRSSEQHPVLFANRVFWLSSLEAVSCFILNPAAYALQQMPPPQAAITTLKCTSPRLIMAAVNTSTEMIAEDVASDTGVILLTPVLCLKWLEQRLSEGSQSDIDKGSTAPKTLAVSLHKAFGSLNDAEEPEPHPVASQMATTHKAIASIARHNRSLASAVVGTIEKSWAQAAAVALRVRCHDCSEHGFVLASLPAFDIDACLQDSNIRKVGTPHLVLLARSVLQRARVSCASWLAQQLCPHLCVSLGQTSAVGATFSVVEILLHTLGSCGACIQLTNEEVMDTSIGRRRIWHELAARVGAHAAAAGYRARGLPVPLVAVVPPICSPTCGTKCKTEAAPTAVPISTMSMTLWTARHKVQHVDTRHAPTALANSSIAFVQSGAGASHKHGGVLLEQRDIEPREQRASELATLHADVPPACVVRWALSAGSAACGSGAADAAWRWHDTGALAFFFGGRIVCLSGEAEATMFLATPHPFAAIPPPPRVARPAVVMLPAAQQGHSRLKPAPPPPPKARTKVPVAKSQTSSEEKEKPCAPGSVALRGLCAHSWVAGVAMGNGAPALRHGKQWYACEFPPPADNDGGLDTTALSQLGNGDQRELGQKQDGRPQQSKAPISMGKRRGVVFVFETERAARLFRDNAVSTLRDLCRSPPSPAPAALAPFLSAGTLDEATLFAVTEALESVAGLTARATTGARYSPKSQCMKLPALSVAETALKFMALQLRANNPRAVKHGNTQLQARREALVQFERDCIAHKDVLESAPRGGAADAVRALRTGADGDGGVEGAVKSMGEQGIDASSANEGVTSKSFKDSAVSAFRAHAAHFDELRAMSREQLYDRFMCVEEP